MKALIFSILAATPMLPTATLAAEGDIRAAYREAYVMDRFWAADVNGDSVLDRSEAGAASHFYEGAEGGRRFDVTDTNNDGVLSADEVQARYRFEVANGRDFAFAQQKVLYNVDRFRSADSNGDGVLSRAEANASRVGRDLFGNTRFFLADTNGDGVLSLAEAAARMRLERTSF
ncbi:MAG TPA: hypothetical protein ENK28_05640 [Aliiroseovarius sp.]|nr:hypothetical protein [Aliiroseovarius sp.]